MTEKNAAAVYDNTMGMYNTEACVSDIRKLWRADTGEASTSQAMEPEYSYLLMESLQANIDENYGLPSKNVNDMAAYQEGVFVATDNGVAFYNGKKRCLVPENMPEALKNLQMQSCFYKG